MEREEILSELRVLLSIIQIADEKTAVLSEAENELARANEFSGDRLRSFDEANQDAFIKARIGEEPHKPKGLIKLAVPVYMSRKKDYEKALAEYRKAYDETFQAYLEAYADQRKALEQEDAEERSRKIQSAQSVKFKAEEQVRQALELLNANTLLSDRLKTTESVSCLIEYFEDSRVDTLKEAVNLYYDDQHRKRLEEYAQEQVKLTAKAEESARAAMESVEKAMKRADEAVKLAQEALDQAEEAFDKAEDAFDRAEDAFDKAEEACEIAEAQDTKETDV